ncbi:Uncharacterized protein FVE85_1040 [Porphyridium purpureum]|uniref:Histone deacetylase domain-containing protein n=1 Tax=Porphyridium purpureum TaxID=35688 RepID=A0A5J4Z0D1_PORPP|nr:Uncharacterized protein FVE85_1040 [Porphyridium purpureum]|eukprot:POR5949..scf208_2
MLAQSYGRCGFVSGASLSWALGSSSKWTSFVIPRRERSKKVRRILPPLELLRREFEKNMYEEGPPKGKPLTTEEVAEHLKKEAMKKKREPPRKFTGAPGTRPYPAYFFYNDEYQVELPERYQRFPMKKYGMVRRKLQDPKYMTPFHATFTPSSLATMGELSMAHCPDYVGRYIRGQFTEDEITKSGFPWSEQHVLRSMSTVGGTLDAVRVLAARSTAFVSGHLAGGTHHAGYASPAGFCIFNDLAVAAIVAQQRHGFRKILIVDTDVHPGEGTSLIFRHLNVRDIFTLSLHCASNIFGEQPVSDMDVVIPDGCFDEQYLTILAKALDAAWLASEPELVLFQAGVDIAYVDRIGRLNISSAGVLERTRYVLDYALDMDRFRSKRLGTPPRAVPVAICMGGGYPKNPEENSPEFKEIVSMHAEVYRLAAKRNRMAQREFKWVNGTTEYLTPPKEDRFLLV